MSWKGISRSLLTTPCSEKNKTAKFLNLFPYCADYFGHKRHMDGNKKLVMYGVKYVLAFDATLTSLMLSQQCQLKTMQ